mmetsp:Transcript_51366/g.116826  ORF Transcript_51366/g.116826 Transcript_51366/m.116826 type:complete len:211 (+) Transcript_51366:402-1034(+)
MHRSRLDQSPFFFEPSLVFLGPPRFAFLRARGVVFDEDGGPVVDLLFEVGHQWVRQSAGKRRAALHAPECLTGQLAVFLGCCFRDCCAKMLRCFYFVPFSADKTILEKLPQCHYGRNMPTSDRVPIHLGTLVIIPVGMDINVSEKVLRIDRPFLRRFDEPLYRLAIVNLGPLSEHVHPPQVALGIHEPSFCSAGEPFQSLSKIAINAKLA